MADLTAVARRQDAALTFPIKVLHRNIAPFVRRLGYKVRGDGDNSISLLLPNGSRIVGLPGTEATVRGFPAVSMMLIDEAAQVKDELARLRPRRAASVSPGKITVAPLRPSVSTSEYAVIPAEAIHCGNHTRA